MRKGILSHLVVLVDGEVITMERQELAKKIRESVQSIDRERVLQTFYAIEGQMHMFKVNEIGLQATYPNMKYESDHLKLNKFTLNGVSLVFKVNQEQDRISVTKESGEIVEELDQIFSEDGVAKCKDGEFNPEELTRYLNQCFADLVQ